MPVPGNPDDVVAFGFGFGWNFIDRFRDFLIHSNSRSWFLTHLRGKGLVNRAARQHLEFFTSCAVRLRGLFWNRYDSFLRCEVVAAQDQGSSHDDRGHVLSSHGVPFNHTSFQFFATG